MTWTLMTGLSFFFSVYLNHLISICVLNEYILMKLFDIYEVKTALSILTHLAESI